MSEFLVTDKVKGLDESDTVEGRLADIIESEHCIVHIDEYKLSVADTEKLVRALRLADGIIMSVKKASEV